MSSGTCNAGVEEKGRAAHCFRPMGHPGDHMAELLPVQLAERCGVTMSFSDGVIHQCTNPPRHIEDHYDAGLGISWPKEPEQPCGMLHPDGELDCSYPSGHAGTGHQTRDEEGVLHTWYGVPRKGPSIPHTVRTRVELHRAQTEYDLTVLRNRIDCLPTVTSTAKELRRKREQLTAELDAWTYLAGVAKNQG